MLFMSIICKVITAHPLICDGFLQPVCNDKYKAFLDFLQSPSPSVNDKKFSRHRFQHSHLLVTIPGVSLHITSPPHNLWHKTSAHKTWNVAINIQIWNYIRAARDSVGPLFTLFPYYGSAGPAPSPTRSKIVWHWAISGKWSLLSTHQGRPLDHFWGGFEILRHVCKDKRYILYFNVN